MGRGRNNSRADQLDAAKERDALERRFTQQFEFDDALGRLMTAHGGRVEPLHRWMTYRQGFAPELVRRFLANASPTGMILDPFSGSGTVAIECARAGRAAVGVDVVSSLAFLTRARSLSSVPSFAPHGETTREWMEAASAPSDVAALLLVEAALHDGEGHRLKGADAPRALLEERLRMMTADLEDRPSTAIHAVVGDARRLPFAEGSFGGVLTSPPYLSRYDYARINDPMEQLLTLHRQRNPARGKRARQVRAARGTALGKAPKAPLHPAAEEAAVRLDEAGEARLASAVRGYFADMDQVLTELARVLAPESPCWIVVAGADLKKIYVPSDLILAEQAENRGFHVKEVVVGRRLRPSGRRMGSLFDISPRETLLKLARQ